jgi:hypothetical protein
LGVSVILKWSYCLLKFKIKSFLWNLLFHALVNYLKNASECTILNVSEKKITPPPPPPSFPAPPLLYFSTLPTYFFIFPIRAPDNFQVQRVITPYFWKWCVFAYFLCTVVLSTSETIAYMYTFKIMFDTSVIQ